MFSRKRKSPPQSNPSHEERTLFPTSADYIPFDLSSETEIAFEFSGGVRKAARHTLSKSPHTTEPLRSLQAGTSRSGVRRGRTKNMASKKGEKGRGKDGVQKRKQSPAREKPKRSKPLVPPTDRVTRSSSRQSSMVKAISQNDKRRTLQAGRRGSGSGSSKTKRGGTEKSKLVPKEKGLGPVKKPPAAGKKRNNRRKKASKQGEKLERIAEEENEDEEEGDDEPGFPELKEGHSAVAQDSIEDEETIEIAIDQPTKSPQAPAVAGRSHQSPPSSGGRNSPRTGSPAIVPSFEREWLPAYRNKQPRALKRVVNGCYLNAALQMLANAPVVVNFVEAFHVPEQCSSYVNNGNCLRCGLKEFIQAYWAPEDPKEEEAKRRLDEAVEFLYVEFSERYAMVEDMYHVEAGQQLGTDEFLQWLIDGITRELQEVGVGLLPSWMDLFYASYEGFVMCRVCGEAMVTTPDSHKFFHQLYRRRAGATPEALFKDWLKPQEYDPGETRLCNSRVSEKSPHTLGRVNEQFRYLRFPEFFYLATSISKSDPQKSNSPEHSGWPKGRISVRKDFTPLELPKSLTWDVTRFFSSTTKEKVRYKLTAISAHRGTIDSGHFIAGVIGPDSRSFDCDDSRHSNGVVEVSGLRDWWNLKKGATLYSFQIDAYCFTKVTGDDRYLAHVASQSQTASTQLNLPDNNFLGANTNTVATYDTLPKTLQDGFLFVDGDITDIERKEVGLFPRTILDGRHFIQVPLHFTDGRKHASLTLSGVSNGSLNDPPDMNSMRDNASHTRHRLNNVFLGRRTENVPFDGDLGRCYLEAIKDRAQSLEIGALENEVNNLKEKIARFVAAGQTVGNQDSDVTESLRARIKDGEILIDVLDREVRRLNDRIKNLQYDNDRLRKAPSGQQTAEPSHAQDLENRKRKAEYHEEVRRLKRQVTECRESHRSYEDKVARLEHQLKGARDTIRTQKNQALGLNVDPLPTPSRYWSTLRLHRDKDGMLLPPPPPVRSGGTRSPKRNDGNKTRNGKETKDKDRE